MIKLITHNDLDGVLNGILNILQNYYAIAIPILK